MFCASQPVSVVCLSIFCHLGLGLHLPPHLAVRGAGAVVGLGAELRVEVVFSVYKIVVVRGGASATAAAPAGLLLAAPCAS